MAKLKIGRKFFDITETDVVMFNGACWQLMTQTVRSGWYDCYPTVSKTLCGKLLKKDILILVDKKGEFIAENGKQMGRYYYRFNIDKLNEYLSKE